MASGMVAALDGYVKTEDDVIGGPPNPNGAAEAGGMTTSGAAGGAVSADGGGGADSGEGTEGKRRKRPGVRSTGEKGKGLRHFSLKVCEKVESKGRTTYNEVADELVAEITGPDKQLMPQDQQYDEKNIRRRVYDALNVLMAMDIISKEKKEIKWKGLPPSTGSHDMLQNEKQKIQSRLEKKRASHQELQEQVAAIERLIRRNETSFQSGGPPPGSGVGLPFILVQTRPQATVEVEISEDMQLVHFDFGSTPFELHDDSFVLRAMGLAAPPLNDVFPSQGPGEGAAVPMGGVLPAPGAAPGLTGPQGPQAGHVPILPVPDPSVALAATSSAPQAPGGAGYAAGGTPMSVDYTTALGRSASLGANAPQHGAYATGAPQGGVPGGGQYGVGGRGAMQVPVAGSVQQPGALQGAQQGTQAVGGALAAGAPQQSGQGQGQGQGSSQVPGYISGAPAGSAPAGHYGYQAGAFPTANQGSYQAPDQQGLEQGGSQAVPYGAQYSGVGTFGGQYTQSGPQQGDGAYTQVPVYQQPTQQAAGGPYYQQPPQGPSQ